MDSPLVTFERNVVMVYCSMSDETTPWRVSYTMVDNRQFIALKAEMQCAMKRMAGISEQGNGWSGFLRVMVNTRDKAVEQFIDARYADSDDVKPSSFHSAYLGANVPSTMQIAMGCVNDSHQMWVLTSSRKGTTIAIELTEENLAYVFINIKHYANQTMIESRMDYEEGDDDDGDEIVKCRRNNGKLSYLVEWRDASGKWRKRWASFHGEAMRGPMKDELHKFYERHHVPPGDPREISGTASTIDPIARRRSDVCSPSKLECSMNDASSPSEVQQPTEGVCASSASDSQEPIMSGDMPGGNLEKRNKTLAECWGRPNKREYVSIRPSM